MTFKTFATAAALAVAASPVRLPPCKRWITGAYTLTLTGFNSASIGSHAGNVAVTAVPEPQGLALLFAGWGVVAFVARQRRV